MSSDAATVLSLAMNLPESERLGIVQKLIESLGTEAPNDDRTLVDEINARRQGVQSGNYIAREWRNSVDEIRDSLARNDGA